MKKAVFTLLAFLMLGTSFAECRSLNLGFVTIISGTYQVLVQTGYDQNLNPIYELQTRKCSEGNRWQWFWE
ncbi:MAG: hypothetical protein CFE23_05110 [Flavobacterium sp. BFFFF1]|uniref:hypothetical protein n=1 Tax=unclassified Flavobacterium TaxID=196869 RepID=UPI000BCC727B|nr:MULTISPECIES: hypothetical protein [unclassified Flavobacterium]OYU81465.1 MAG: hypothetical protein CFE23_05110 [Flavobacterium sp. BFFFF1]